MTTLSKPSAPQKRACAKGKSAEIHSTTVLFNSLATLLNWRTLAAQTPVSTLGKIFNTLRLPANVKY